MSILNRLRSLKVNNAIPDFAAATWRILEEGNKAERPRFDAATLGSLPPGCMRNL